MKFLLTPSLVLLLAIGCFAADTSQPENGFTSLFDGKTLDGWKVGENANAFEVHDGMIVMEYPATDRGPAHLFYVGSVNDHNFKNFDLRVEVMTFPGANSGIYFHTKYQEANWPKCGLECQVDNSHSDWRRTGSLYGIRNISWGPGTTAVRQQANGHRFAETAGHGQRLVHPGDRLPGWFAHGQAQRPDHGRVPASRRRCRA